MTKGDKTAGILLVALFGYGMYMATTFPDRSAYFPMFICGAGLLLSVLLIVSAFVKEKSGKSGEEKEKMQPEQRKRLLLMGILIIAYAAAIGAIGFTVSTIVFMMAASVLLYPGKLTKEDKKPILIIVISSVVISLLIFVIFNIK